MLLGSNNKTSKNSVTKCYQMKYICYQYYYMLIRIRCDVIINYKVCTGS